MRAEPIQARAVATRERILDAARAVYADKGRDRFDTKDVAATAGVAIGTVYRYFEDRVDLMDVIAPDRDLPDERLVLRIEQYIRRHGALPDGTHREVMNFLKENPL